MPRYWVIAPVESKPPELFDKVWQFDVDNNLISIGWSQLGDVSKMNRDTLYDAIAATYPEKPPATWGLMPTCFGRSIMRLAQVTSLSLEEDARPSQRLAR